MLVCRAGTKPSSGFREPGLTTGYGFLNVYDILRAGRSSSQDALKGVGVYA